MNEFLWFLWKWAFDPTAVLRDPTRPDDPPQIERFDRRDYWNIFQPNWWRYRFAEEQLPCGCQSRKWGMGQILWCMSHAGGKDEY